MKKYIEHISLPMGLSISFFICTLGVVVGLLIVNAHDGDVSQIHACVKTHPTNGPNIRIIDANDICNKKETSLDWNIQGPLGPSGPPGPGGSSTLVCIGCTARDLLIRTGTQNLSGINLDLANIAFANLLNENFSGTSFIRAVITATNIDGGNFTNSDLENSNLTASAFRGADFLNSNLTNVDMTDANLEGAVNMMSATRSGIIWSSTRCPDGTSSNSNGGTCEGHL